MNAESLCVPRDQPEKESKREKKRKKEKHGVTKLLQARPNSSILKGTFIPVLCIEGNERWKAIQSQPKHYICFVFIETRIFSSNISHKQYCVHYLLGLEVCEHFMTRF